MKCLPLAFLLTLLVSPQEARACSYRLGPWPTVAPPPDAADNQPPEAATVEHVAVILKQDPVDTGSFSCPDIDMLRFRVHGRDDRTPDAALRLVAYIGRTARDAAELHEPTVTFGFEDVQTREVRFGIGKSVGRERDGEPFRSAERFCFSVALLDAGDNVGPRSEPFCLTTRDEKNPLVQFQPGQACRCSTVGASGDGASAWVVAGVLALGFVQRRRGVAVSLRG